MDALLRFLPRELASEVVAIPIALALLVVAFSLLPTKARRRARQAAALLGLGVVATLLRAVVGRDPALNRPLVFFTTFALLASIGRSLVLLVLDVVVDRHAARPTPKIFRDLSTAIVYMLVGLVTLRSVGVEPGSILTTSALLTAVVGLSLQDTLGNLVSGLALQMQRPFDVGDWIEVDGGKHAGRVTEVNWRATSVMTIDDVEVILPNASLARAAIHNYSRPSTISRRNVVVGVSYAAPPDRVHRALLDAARDVVGVLATPGPSVRTLSFGDSAIHYQLLYHTNDHGHGLDVDGRVRDRVYYALARDRLEIPFPIRTIVQPQGVDPAARRAAEIARHEAAIAGVSLLAALPPDSRRALAERSELRMYGPGEAILRKGDRSTEMFVIEEGEVSVEVPLGTGGSADVATLKQGDCFGEMALLTGDPRSAAVRATTLCHLLAIGHVAFQSVLCAHPEVVDELGRLLDERQAHLDAAAEAHNNTEFDAGPRSIRLIGRIRAFFKLG